MFETLEQFKRGFVFDRHSINEIDIGVKNNKQMFVALEGGGGITAWEISSNQIWEFFGRRDVDDGNSSKTCSAGQ